MNLERNMSFMFCQFCGARNKSDNKFCENCGQTMKDDHKSTQIQAQPANVQYSGYQKYQSQQAQQVTSISGSYDAVPGQQYPYPPKKRNRMPTWVKVLIIVGFIGPPLIFFIIFFGILWPI